MCGVTWRAGSSVDAFGLVFYVSDQTLFCDLRATFPETRGPDQASMSVG